jgi:hypothetical protein
MKDDQGRQAIRSVCPVTLDDLRRFAVAGSLFALTTLRRAISFGLERAS